MSGIKFTDDQIDYNLTMLGLEVEERIPTVPNLEGVVVGHVMETENVEDSDHLSKCLVDIGSEQLQIICGAPNIASGQKVPVATIGTTLPGGFKIKKAKLRGITSYGMICSEKELSLSQNADGIMVLHDNTEIGKAFNELLDESDTIFDVFITPNRSDCMSAIGIARELSISVGKKMKSPLESTPKGNTNIVHGLKISIENPVSCARYSGIVIKDVVVGDSPEWLVKRLGHLGLRSISNIVDITNLVMFETGQPLHAFDYNKISGAEIIVRNASKGEKFITLDDQQRELDASDLLICDREKPVAIAGVMGGLDSEVTSNTTNILLEVANFEPTTIRRTSSRLGLSTDASKRFERGVDPNITAKVSDRAIQLILELAGGTVSSDFVDVYPQVITASIIKLRMDRLTRIIGEKIGINDVVKYLKYLECTIKENKNSLEVVPPTFRPDLTREIDLIEEIARLYGYNEINDQLENSISVLNPKNEYVKFIDNVKKNLVTFGLMESVTISMASEKSCTSFVPENFQLAHIINPLSEDMAVLRPTIASTLLASIAYNLNRKNNDVRLFEVGSVFLKDGTKLNETLQLEGLLTGQLQPKSWNNPSPSKFSFYNVKGIVQQLLADFKIATIEFLPKFPKWYSYGITLMHNKQCVGHLGLLSNEILNGYDIQQPVFAFNLNLEVLFSIFNGNRIYKEISRFPAIDRDIALVVDKSISAQIITDTIKNTAGKLLKNLLLFDVYEGDRIASNKKSLAFSLIFQSPERTLNEIEINQLMDKIIAAVNQNFNAELRQ
ncbi:MAG: phenylalanine--tRNA ligase subunit beta [Deferribacteres bacterium]|nr:phenylalanine--tRNA ligase subunit beta [candidate division KSB1 bacterium]MCB9501404.1 phenylalanine--tRNA ligase subunit beta [Deferribacteres bacterium]